MNLYNVLKNLTETLLDNQELWRSIPDNRNLMESFASQRIKNIHGIPAREVFDYDNLSF
jgi:hypothetical protein